MTREQLPSKWSTNVSTFPYSLVYLLLICMLLRAAATGSSPLTHGDLNRALPLNASLPSVLPHTLDAGITLSKYMNKNYEQNNKEQRELTETTISVRI